MTRALLLLLAATGASAQTPIETLYGTWEVTRDTTVSGVLEDGTKFRFGTLYASLEISEAALTDISVSVQPTERAPSANVLHFTYRVEGQDLVFTDGVRVRLRAVGERLGMKWTQAGASYPEVLFDRAGPSDVPEAIRGVWVVYIADEAGAVLDLPVRIDARSITFGNEEAVPARYADGLLLVSDAGAAIEPAEIQQYRVFVVREEGEVLVLDADGDEALRLVRP